MLSKGTAHVQACAGDAGPFANGKATKVFAAGKTWKGGGMSCTVTRSSATCKNKSKHGFTLYTPLGPNTGAHYKRFEQARRTPPDSRPAPRSVHRDTAACLRSHQIAPDSPWTQPIERPKPV
jgi:Family of unknown function (DUF6636)